MSATSPHMKFQTEKCRQISLLHVTCSSWQHVTCSSWQQVTSSCWQHVTCSCWLHVTCSCWLEVTWPAGVAGSSSVPRGWRGHCQLRGWTTRRQRTGSSHTCSKRLRNDVSWFNADNSKRSLKFLQDKKLFLSWSELKLCGGKAQTGGLLWLWKKY